MPYVTGTILGTFGAGTVPAGICIDGIGNVWVSNALDNTVQKFSPAGVSLGVYPVGRNPYRICTDGTNIYAANYGDSTVTKLLASTGAVLWTQDSHGTNPLGICFDGTYIWTASTITGRVCKLLALDGSFIGTYVVGTQPWAICFDGTNIWCTNLSDGTVTKLLASSGSVIGTYPVGVAPYAILSQGTNIWTANEVGTVSQLRGATGALVSTVTGFGSPAGLCFDTRNLWVSDFTGYMVTVNPVTASIVARYPLAGQLDTSVFNGGNSVWVVNESANNITEFGTYETTPTGPPFPATGTILGNFQTGPTSRGVCCDGPNIWVAVQGNNTVVKMSLAGTALGSFPVVGTSPVGICFDGFYIWTTNTGSANVTKLLAATGAVVGTYAAGPTGIGICFDGSNIWVTNQANNTVTKLLAATGNTVGTYPTGITPVGCCFDGVNVWVVNQADGTVTKFIAVSGAVAGTYRTGGTTPRTVCFDGSDIWVTSSNLVSQTISRLLASTGALLGIYPAGPSPYACCFDGANIWVTNQQLVLTNPGATTAISAAAAPGAIIGTFSLPLDGNVRGIVYDNNHGIWITSQNTAAVTKLADYGFIAAPFSAPVTINEPVQVSPQQLSTADGTIQGGIDGLNNLFTFGVYLPQVQLFRNGSLQTQGVDFNAGTTAIVFLPGSIPQPGDVLTIEGFGAI